MTGSRGQVMIKKQLSIISPVIVLLAIALTLAGKVKNDEEKVLTKTYVFFTDDAKKVNMTRQERQAHGGESSFLTQKMFNDYEESLSFPLVQKKEAILGQTPKNLYEIAPKADFSIKTQKQKTFYKLKRVTAKSNLKYCNKVICMSLFQRSKMGKIKNTELYLNPRDIGHKDKFSYSFPYTITTKKYGIIPYTCFVTKGNKKLDTILKTYMKLRKRKKPKD